MRKILFLLLSFLLAACANPKPQNAAAAAINVQLGLAYLEHGDLARAKNKLLLALSQNTVSDLTQDALGYFFEKTGAIKTAEKYYLKAITLATNKGAAYNNYGAFLYRQKDYRAALQYFNLAAQDPYYLHPDVAHNNAVLTRKKINHL